MYIIEEINHDNSFLKQVIIKNKKSNFYSTIYSNLGASLQQLSLNGIEIIDGISNNLEGLSIYKNTYKSSFLFPFPNRIRDGKYLFDTNNYELEINEIALNNAIHGHIYNKSFSIKNKQVSKNNATITFSYLNDGSTKGFPFSYQFEITYTFTSEKIGIEFNALNTGNKAFPFGIGWHPYFKASNLNESILDFTADQQYLVDKKMIPTNKTPLKFETPLLLGKTFLDDCFITKQSKASYKTNNYKIDLDFSTKKPNSFLQVYTPDSRDTIAIEPMTCAPNSFNNKDGLLILKPSEKYKWKINLGYSIKQ